MPIQTIKSNLEESPVLFLTFKIINGLPIFTSKPYFDIVLDGFKWCREKYQIKIYAYTILINHIHSIIEFDDNYKGEKVINVFKGYTANQVIKKLREDLQFDLIDELYQLSFLNKSKGFKLWERNNWPISITTEKFFNQKIDYIDYNAEKHRLVKDIENYLYTSYHNHYCQHSVIFETDEID